MKSIYGITLEKLKKYFENIGEKPFKAIQVYEWIYKKRVNSFDEFSNLKKDTISKLKEDFTFTKIKLVDKKTDKDVSKYLFESEDKNKIEAVLMNHDYGNSLCVSTEVGCNMGCKFCESGRLKKVRNLNTNEMVEQILTIESLEGIRISHVVLMGIGEPFDNSDHVIDFIDIINEGKGIDIGARHITVSTCGLVPKIIEFMNHGKQVNLAISLHAPNNELRDKLMPINRAYKLEELMSVLKKYVAKTNRRVTFEYILLSGVNDTLECAKELANLVKDLNCYINLIPYNETSHIEFKRSSQDTIMAFYDCLKKNKINVTIRREFGGNVDAACGQLRSNYEEGK